MTRQGGGWSFVRKLLWMAGVLAVPAAVGALCVGIIMHVRSLPTYGDAQNSEEEFTLAPNVSVQILPAHRDLIGKELLDFAVNDQGAIAVNTSAGLFDLAGGRRIGPGTDGYEQVVNSMAFAKPGLFDWALFDLDAADDAGLPNVDPGAAFEDEAPGADVPLQFDGHVAASETGVPEGARIEVVPNTDWLDIEDGDDNPNI